MPFDFINCKHYTIDYSDLFNELNSKRYLKDSNVQNKYLEVWIKTLMNYDRNITEQLKTKESIINMISLLQSEPEIFPYQMNYGKNEILIHFRVSIANELISSEGKGEFVPIDEFVKEDRLIHWSPVNENVNSYSDANDPIIIVPFLHSNRSFIVIDGNHRVTYKVKNKINSISAVTISEQTVIEWSLFSSGFDKMFYIMWNEINHMAYATATENIDAMELVNKSYLVDERFKFI